MITRRKFLGVLAALPLVGRMLSHTNEKPSREKELLRIQRQANAAIAQMRTDLALYGNSAVMIGEDGTLMPMRYNDQVVGQVVKVRSDGIVEMEITAPPQDLLEKLPGNQPVSVSIKWGGS